MDVTGMSLVTKFDLCFKKRYDENNETMILSQGLGSYGKKMRLNTNPETIIIILRSTNSES